MVETQDNASLLYNWMQECEKENIVLSFKGDFNQDLVNAILLLAERGQNIQNGSTVVRARVFSIMVECMQNIRKYGAVNDGSGELKPGIVLVCRTTDSYSLITGNLVLNEEVASLKAQIDKIKLLNKEELKSLHKSVLTKTELSEKSGAGLGLISIARKSDAMEYQFKQLDDKISFYSVNITVSINSGT